VNFGRQGVRDCGIPHGGGGGRSSWKKGTRWVQDSPGGGVSGWWKTRTRSGPFLAGERKKNQNTLGAAKKKMGREKVRARRPRASQGILSSDRFFPQKTNPPKNAQTRGRGLGVRTLGVQRWIIVLPRGRSRRPSGARTGQLGDRSLMFQAKTAFFSGIPSHGQTPADGRVKSPWGRAPWALSGVDRGGNRKTKTGGKKGFAQGGGEGDSF